MKSYLHGSITNACGGDRLAPRPKLLRRKYFNATFFCHLYTIQKILFLLLNFYFCDSTAVKSLINLSHSFSTSTLLLLNRTCKYFIRVSCVRESTDTGRQLIYTKQSFCYKSKEIFHRSKKGFLSLVSQWVIQNDELHINSFQKQIFASISVN